MGGQLTVQSVLGEGSKFSFDAAFGVGTARVNAERPERVSDLAGRRVLLIEPDSMDRLILSKMCYAWGMFPSEAESLAEANSLIADSLRDQRPFALAILEANGFDDLRQIRAQTPELPVVLTTSDNQPGDVTKARSLGAAAFMVKPIRRNELLRIVLAAITAQPVTHAPQARAPGIMKILVAEDSEDNRFLLEVYLKDPAYALQFVENGMQAIDLFGKDDFDLVLMDVQMPVMDGLRATESIRALERRLTRTPTPIIALTANGLVSDIERSQAAGCNGHLTKPISKERLLTAIENCRLLVG
jgi:CheY-like chemotaxis protein